MEGICPTCKGPIDKEGKSLDVPKADKFYNPSLATDALVLRKHKDDNFHDILLVTRKYNPFKGRFAFPGGFVNYNEEPLKGCLRELEEECTLKGKNPELVAISGDPKRDPRKHVVSFCYKVEVGEDDKPIAADDAATASFYPLNELLKKPERFAFDHHSIIEKYILKTYPQYASL